MPILLILLIRIMSSFRDVPQRVLIASKIIIAHGRSQHEGFYSGITVQHGTAFAQRLYNNVKFWHTGRVRVTYLLNIAQHAFGDTYT